MNRIQKVSLHLVYRNPGWPLLIAGAPALSHLYDRNSGFSRVAQSSKNLSLRAKE